MPIVELTGLQVIMDVTPRWWRDGSGIRRSLRPSMVGPVIGAAMAELRRMATSIGYDMRKEAFEAVVIVPKDVTLEALERKREEVLDKLEALKPHPAHE